MRLRRLTCVRRVLVLGDSHARVFGHPMFAWQFPLTSFEIICVAGATASGLDNPNSKTQSHAAFSEALERIRRRTTIILMLGEVDTGFVIWYRAKKYDCGVEEMLARAVRTYTRFIEQARAHGETIVISAPLPTIQDGSAWGEVANLRKEVTATQRDRTALTIRFNAEVESRCRDLGIGYLNLDTLCLGADGLVNRHLLNKDSRNHHYDRRAYARLISAQLKAIV